MTRRWWFIVVVILAVAGIAGHAIAPFAALAVIGVVYVAWCRLFPHTRHRACGGTGRRGSRLFPWAYHRCGGCQNGREIRWGARVAGTPAIREQHERESADRDLARSRNAWR